jgi:hypothetical protein
MCLYKAFRHHIDPFLGVGPFNGFAIYTVLMYLCLASQLIFGVLVARRARKVRTGELRVPEGVQMSREEHCEALISKHKQLILMGVLWLSDPAMHRIVFWARVFFNEFVYYPATNYASYRGYMDGARGDFDIVKLWADPTSVAYVFSVGKVWVNLANFIITALYMFALAAGDDPKRARAPDALASAARAAGGGPTAEAETGMKRKRTLGEYWTRFPILVVNMGLFTFWEWANNANSILTATSGVPGGGQVGGIPPLIWAEIIAETGLTLGFYVWAFC